MRITTRLIALALAALMLCASFIGCGNNDPALNENDDQTGDNAPGNENDNPATAKTYTLNDYIDASPLTWNPHNWETNADSYFSNYTEMGFMDTTIGPDGSSFEWVYEMATNIEDITASFPDKDKWNISEDAGRVFKITLNPLAAWEDGTKINADTYIYSMKALLDPKMQNYRANTYYDGSTAILNADKYFNSETPIYSSVVPAYGDEEEPDYSYDIEANKVYMHLTTKGMTLTGSYSVFDLFDMGYIDAESYTILSDNANSFGYVEINDTTREAAKKVCTDFVAAFGLEYDDTLFMEMLFYNTGEFSAAFDFANVGLYKSGEYELTYITAQQVEMFYFLTNMTGNWLVYEELYEAGKTTTGDLVTTNYGTSVDTYMSYGPYKLVSFEKDKQMVMEKYPAWYGYTDGKHENQYMTTAIKCDVVADHNTALMLFNQGKLDSVTLESDDMTTYRMSDYLLKLDTDYTFRYIFASDITKLAALETSEGDNKKVLSYDDFRKAISLSMDRTTFCQQATPAYKPSYSLYTALYYYDVANDPNSIYRNTDEAKIAVISQYGVEYGEGKEYATLDDAYAAVTGYDVEEAKKLFQSVYDQAIADGNYIDGQKITINCMVGAYTELTPDDLKQEQLLNQFISEATEGTGFEGNVSFVFKCGAAKRYEDVANGRIEMIRGAWGGAIYYPFSAIRCYTDPDYQGGLDKVHESCGWNPTTETLELTVDVNGDGTVETETKTLQEWTKLINGGIQDADGNTIAPAITDMQTKVKIFAALEQAVIESYQCIPYAAEVSCSLYSQQIEYATLDYNVMYGYGGIRLMTYNYDDAAWEAYVSSQGGTLSYE